MGPTGFVVLSQSSISNKQLRRNCTVKEARNTTTLNWRYCQNQSSDCSNFYRACL